MSLKTYCQALPKEDLFEKAMRLCEKILRLWENYYSDNDLTYSDTVVGLHHEVRRALLFDSIVFCREYKLGGSINNKRLDELLDEFSDPIVALQNDDWELPNDVRKTFYAIYNLLTGIREPRTVSNELTLVRVD